MSVTFSYLTEHYDWVLNINGASIILPNIEEDELVDAICEMFGPQENIALAMREQFPGESYKGESRFRITKTTPNRLRLTVVEFDEFFVDDRFDTDGRIVFDQQIGLMSLVKAVLKGMDDYNDLIRVSGTGYPVAKSRCEVLRQIIERLESKYRGTGAS